ncbi:MFS transporter [Pseudonocardia sp. GCM10023141]|uniref:MFS transporter n=1 Tax=Pseudonocardia sp. GCM10023141 TaxID=3252653 RepID=UPI00361B68C7
MTGGSALAEPTVNVRPRWVLSYSAAWIGVFIALFGPLQILLPRQIEALAPDTKEASLALVLGCGAAFALVANPLFGALSDRTTSRFGRRRPWILVGTAGGFLAIVLLSSASTIVMVVIGWCAVQTMVNGSYSALSAVVPDQVPAKQRGTAAGFFGLAQIVGIATGTVIATVSGDTVVGYLVCGGCLVITAVPFLFQRGDRILARHDRPALTWAAVRGVLWVNPRRHPDFGWGWLTRFLMNLANSVALLYLFFFLKDSVGLADPAAGVLILTGINIVATFGSVAISGIWSDRIGKRRVFVCGAGLTMAAAMLLLAVWTTWPGAILAAIVLGIGFGGYTAVDFALLTQLLPASADRGKDLGVLNIAGSLPQVIAPVIAAPIVTNLGGYPTLYAVAAAFGAVGAVLVYRIKSVR